MRIFTLILAVLCIIAAAGLGFIRAGTNLEQAKIDQQALDILKGAGSIGEAAKTAGGDEFAAEIKSAEDRQSGLKTGAYLMYAAAAFALLLLIVAFVKKPTLVFGIGGLLIVLTIAMILVNPQYDVGATSAASARDAAMIVGVPAILGAIFAMLSEKLRQRKAAAAV